MIVTDAHLRLFPDEASADGQKAASSWPATRPGHLVSWATLISGVALDSGKWCLRPSCWESFDLAEEGQN